MNKILNEDRLQDSAIQLTWGVGDNWTAVFKDIALAYQE